MDNQTKFPEEIAFWNEKASKIQLVNPDDFHLDALLKVLEIKSPLTASFGITDRAEILRRAKILKYLLKNEDFRNALNGLSISSNIDIPESNTAFLQHFFDHSFSPRNPFFEMMGSFVKRIKSYPSIPDELEAFIRFIESTSTEQRQLETSLANDIYNELNKGIFIEGIVTIYWTSYRRFLVSRTEAIGYRRYSYLDYSETVEKPWWRKGIWDTFPLKYVTSRLEKKRDDMIHDKKVLKYGSKPITEVPSSILDAILTRLRTMNGHNVDEFDIRNTEIKYFFRYSDEGLEVKLLGFNNLVYTDKSFGSSSLYISHGFSGYTSKQIAEIQKRNRRLKKKAREIERDNLITRLHEYFGWGQWEDNRFTLIESPQVDTEFKWSMLYDLRKQPQYIDRFEEVKAYREYIRSRLITLREMAGLAESLLRFEKKQGFKFRFPTILPDANHIVAFRNLVPVQILRNTAAEKVVSITSVPSINGEMIGFTGNNAGGKSVTQEAIINAIYMAQSGLPVLGKGFTINVKSALGMVFLERGSGSTAELLLLKSKNILKTLTEIKQNNIFLVLDEIGTGTAEIDGLSYGKRLLERISTFKASVIFSTQIRELAEYAQGSLGAHIIQFDAQHTIKAGIGTGNLSSLIKETGLEEYLN